MAKSNDSIVGNLRFESDIKLKWNETLVNQKSQTVYVIGTQARKITPSSGVGVGGYGVCGRDMLTLTTLLMPAFVRRGI